MKKLLALVLVAALFGACGSAQAAKVWDDMSWWGNTGATPQPVQDTKGRSGYWWWPKEPASNAGDTELWGNRGIVYSQWQKPAPPQPKPAKAPVAAPAPPKHTIPTFSNVLFDFDKSVLKAEGKVEVDKVVTEMKAYSKEKAVINGYTCSVGEEAYNMGLGQRRADAVKKYMVDAGIAESRISTKSYGENNPAVPNDTPANRKLNRRVEFVLSE